MYDVLVPVDESEARASAQVASLVGLPTDPDAMRALVLYVHEEIDAPADEAGPTLIEDINERLDDLQGVPDAVARAERDLSEAGFAVETVETVGDPAAEILAVAADRDVDAICLAGRKRSPVGKALFGSVSQSVILDADTPVIVAPHARE